MLLPADVQESVHSIQIHRFCLCLSGILLLHKEMNVYIPFMHFFTFYAIFFHLMVMKINKIAQLKTHTQVDKMFIKFSLFFHFFI